MTTQTSVAPTAAAVELDRSDRLQPLLLLAAIAAGLTLGRIAPGVGESLAPGVSWGVFVLIYLVMLNVSLSGVARAFGEKRFLATAVVLNFVVNPLLAGALGAVFLQGAADLRVGLVLFLVTPCIGWYLIFTELAGGDTQLGVSLLGVNVLLQVLLLPVYLAIFVGSASPVELSTIGRSIGIYLVLPAALAAASRAVAARSAISVDQAQQAMRAPSLKTLALVWVIVSMFASQAAVIFDNTSVLARLLAPMVLFFVVAFGLALLVGRRMRLPHDQTALLAFTATSRNSEASLAIAATAFVSPLVGLAVVLGPVIELPLLIVMVRILNRRRPDVGPGAAHV